MTFQCEDLERALASEDPTLMDAADRHARSCSRCEAELRLWSNMAAGARSMHRRWDSPTLWPRIRAELVSAGVARDRIGVVDVAPAERTCAPGRHPPAR